MEKRNISIIEYWDKRALEYKLDPKVGWDDLNMNQLELNALTPFIKNGDRILDVGCANGDALNYFLLKNKVEIAGIDISEKMVKYARQRFNGIKCANANKANIMVGDSMHLNFIDNESYDKLLYKRCLINLLSWEHKQKALLEAHRILKRNGLLLLMEGTIQGLGKLNALRKIFSLEEIKVCWHNEFFDEAKLLRFCEDGFELVKIVNFCSTYMIISRVIQPALFKNYSCSSVLNKIAVLMPNIRDYGYIKLFVFRKI